MKKKKAINNRIDNLFPDSWTLVIQQKTEANKILK